MFTICLATAGWAFSFGLGTQLLTLRMDSLGFSDSLIGWNTGIYYLGLALAAGVVPFLMRSFGNWCPILGMFLAGITLAFFPYFDSSAVWFVVRFINGVGGAMSLVPLETYVGRASPIENRSKTFAYYAVALTLGGAAGIGLGVPLFSTESVFPFLLGAAASIVSGAIVWKWLPEQADFSTQHQKSSLRLTSNFLSYGSAWIQGFLEGGMIAFLSLYLLWLGMSEEYTGLMMGVSLAGVILFQIPVGRLADRFGRVTMLFGCYGVIGAGLLIVPACGIGLHLAVWLFLLGAASGALYPLALALLSEKLPNSSLPGAYACFMAMECAGSVMGPIAMGKGRDWFGEPAMFAAGLSALLLVLFPWSAMKLVSRIKLGSSATWNGQARAIDERQTV